MICMMLTACGSESAGETSSAAQPDSSAPPTSTTAPAPTTVPCPPSGARVTPGVVDPAMGLRVMTIELANCGTQPYSVTGYPVLAVLDEDQQPYDVEILHGAEPITVGTEGFCTPTGGFDAGPVPVTLAPGEKAVARVVWRNTTTDELDKLANGVSMSVAPTAEEAPQVIAPPGGVDLGTTGRLGVSAWSPVHPPCW